MECASLKYLSKQDISVPCGNCPFCMATRRSDWALRLHYESKEHLDARFITLTYANAKLHWKGGVSQLCKADLQKWFKKIRKAGLVVRYYAVGEYGSTTYRPHYHVLLFIKGATPSGRALRSNETFPLRSLSLEDIIRKSWNLGQVHIGTVTQASVMYCLGYLVNGKNWTMRKGRVRPYCTMSRRPGLGAGYLSSDMIEWHKSDRKNYAILDGVKRHLPRYYKTKIFTSKIDLVRIAVRDQKAAFKRDVEWLRSPAMAKMKDPLSYRKLQRDRLARKIRDKSKAKLII